MTLSILPSVHMKPISALFRWVNSSYAVTSLWKIQNDGGAKLEMPDPHSRNVKEFAQDYMLYNLLRKSRVSYSGHSLPPEDELVEKAVSSFLEVEQRCKFFNRKGYIPGTAPTSGMLAPEVVFQTARRKIAQVLGDFDLDEMITNIDFSSGASTRLPKKDAAIPVKFTGKLHVTRSCAHLAMTTLWYHEPWRRFCQDRWGRESDPCTWVEVVEGSEYFTVPKTAISVRGAAKEPEFNMLFQKAIGNMLRRRLKRVRIDLNDQTYNQYLARCGSRTGSLATIDLESASDSVSLRLVKDLLPADWYRFIEMTRSSAILLPSGILHTLEKVSSMGNGFTFELESLIFWALTIATMDLTAVEDRRIGVYGDDIIVHHSCAPDLINVLAYCGFSTNTEKTWVTGPFRESCGGHYYEGCDVTPFFIKEDLDRAENRFHVINCFNEWVFRFSEASNEPVLPHDYVVRKLLPKDWGFIPPQTSSQGGIYTMGAAHTPGLVFWLNKSAYEYQEFVPGHLKWCPRAKTKVWVPGVKTRALRTTGACLTWHLKAQAKGCGGEPSQVVIHGERVVWRLERRHTPMWADKNIRLPACLTAL